MMNNQNVSKSVTLPFLNNSFLEVALRNSESDRNLIVTSCKLTRATAPGDNYASEVYRANVYFTRNGTKEMKPFVLKVLSTEEEMNRITKLIKLHEREITALGEISPRIHQLLEAAAPGHCQPFSARCLYSHLDPHVIILDDLKALGFRMADRTVGLDMDHCLLVIRTLARYHAGSVVLYRSHPELFTIFEENILREDLRVNLESMYSTGIRQLAMEIEKWLHFEKYGPIFRRISEVATNLVMNNGSKPLNFENFNVLNHGDLWLNNMMFKYSKSSDEVEDMRFVDFQIGTIGDAALDLQYFINTSPKLEIMKNPQRLLEEYHKAIGDTFKLLGHENLTPSFSQLHKQFQRKGLYGVVVACTTFAVVLADKSDIPDMEKIIKNESTIGFSESYKGRFKELLPVYEERGWLQVESFTI